MTRKSREFNKSLREEKARVKLYKSGKNWVKAGLKEIQLLKMLGLSFVTDKIDKEQNDKTNVGTIIKDNALKTTAITGGLFTVNMLHDQQALAASETPVTSELATNSQTVGDQTSVVIQQSQSVVESEQPSEASESQIASESEISSESTSTESESKQSTSEEQSSASESESKSLSQSESERASQSISERQSELKNTSEQSETLNKNITSEQTQTSKQEGITSTTEVTSNSTTTAEVTTSQSASTSQAVEKQVQNFSGFAFRSVDYSLSRAATTVPTEQVFTGTGFDTQYQKTIYYQLKVTSDGSNMTFQYTVSYDNPNTATIETPGIAASATVATSKDSLFPMLQLGSAYGTPSAATNGHTTGYNGVFLSKPASVQQGVNPTSNGNYWWDTPILNGTNANKGYGLTTKITVPINNPSGDTSWTFRPYASQDGALSPVGNYFNKIETGTEPVSSTSQSQSLQASESKASTSRSVSTSVSQANSQSARTSTSIANSQSASTSVANSQSASTSQSIANSQSASTSKSASESVSVSTSKSASTSISDSQSASK